MKALIYRIEDKLKILALVIDYLIYLVINPFKFKKIPKSINKILIVELLQIGDLIVTTPTLKAVRKKYPEAIIDILILPEMRDVLTGKNDLDKLILYDGILNLIKKIRKDRYDLGIILHPGSFLISLALFLGGVKYRVGSTKAGLLYGKGFFLNKKIKPNLKIQHKIEDNLDVIRSINITTDKKDQEIFTTKESDKFVNNFLDNHKLSNFIVIHPGANFKTHEWPIDRYAQLADNLSKDYRVVFTGSRKDKFLVNNILSLMKNKAYDFSGYTIKDFFSMIKASSLVITVDTAASHVAASFDKPIITLFGASNPDVWYPYTEKRKIIFNKEKCVNCNKNFCFRTGLRKHECMRSITVEDVLKLI